MGLLHIHIANTKDRDATVAITSVKPPTTPKMGLVDKEVTYHRYMSASREGLHDVMQEKFGDDYGQALIDADPEVDMENVGRALPRSSVIYLSSKGDVLYAAPKEVEVIFNPDGTERERRDPQEVAGNVNDEASPVRWTPRRVSKNDAIHKFVFNRSVQLKHVDGLTYDFLFAMAKELHDAEELALLGAGPKGKDPLIFYSNGSPYRGFLEGRVDGEKYQLFLRLSKLELKLPKD